MKKSRFGFFKSKWFWIILVIILIAGGVVYAKTRTKASSFEYATAQIGSVAEQVSVTGTVTPVSQANLSFEKSGVITKIYVGVGDQVNAGDPIASLDSSTDQAAYASAAATLADMTRSLTPEELDVQTTGLSNAVRDAYASAQSAVVNYADPFFTGPQGPNPTINIHTDSAQTQYTLDTELLSVSGALNAWSAEIATSTDTVVLASDSVGYLSTIKSFLNDLAATVAGLTTSNSALPQSALDADVSAMNSAVSNLNAAITSITTAQSDYNLKLAGDSSDSIAAQAAKVNQAKAELDQDTLVSPIDGVVTEEDPNVGEFIAAGQGGFAVEGTGFKVEAYVPEADIAKVAIGDLASSTLDAYGSYVDFPAKVVSIDPAETVLEGVPTYKVTLQFVTPDSRIKDGMTDNLEILTHEATDVLEVPYRAVTITATSSTVMLVSADGKSYGTVPVQIGLKGSDGNIQILSGIQAGDKVVTYVKS